MSTPNNSNNSDTRITIPPPPPSPSPGAPLPPVPMPPLPPACPKLRTYSSTTQGKWEELPLHDNFDTDDPAEKALQEKRRKIKQAIGSVVGSEQLAALFGLGSSASVHGPKMSDLWCLVRDNNLAAFKTMQAKVGDATLDNATGDIEDFLSRCQMIAHAPVNPDAYAPTFIAAAEKTIANACRSFLLVADINDHAHCLRLLARRPPDKSRSRIFTTNYDLCLEEAAAHSGVFIIDGFGRETPPRFDGTNFDIDFVRRRAESKSPEYLDGVIHLVKLHGSVDWTTHDGQVVKRENPDAPIIIYPRSDKFEQSYRQPFLELMSQLQTVLRQPNLGLLIIGFGFADAHLSEMLLAAIRKNLSLRVVVATLDCERHCTEADKWMYRPKLAQLRKLADQGDSRILLLDCDFPTFVRLVPNLGTETEEDKLRAVLRTVLK